jgi:hypothetical protein
MMHLREALDLLDALGIPLPKSSDALMKAINGGRLELTPERNLIVHKKELLP